MRGAKLIVKSLCSDPTGTYRSGSLFVVIALITNVFGNIMNICLVEALCQRIVLIHVLFRLMPVYMMYIQTQLLQTNYLTEHGIPVYE